MRMLSLALPLGFLLAAAVAPVLAQEGEPVACGEFALTGGAKTINVVDRPPEGASPGDLRAGNRELLDDTGAVVGKVHFKSTLTAAAADGRGDVLASEYFVSFADGWIASQSLYELPDARDTSQRAGNATLVVTGGAGAFVKANGMITIEAGDPPTYLFHLACG